MSTTTKLTTAEELLAMGDIGRCELIYGELVMMSPSGFEHTHIGIRVGRLLDVWNDQHKLGMVLGADGGFVVERNPDTVRAPDAAFVEARRIGDKLPTGYFEGAPDLAVEVVSPGDSWPEVNAKAEMWLAHGCKSCWVVDPRSRTVTVYRKDGSIGKFKETDELEDAALPGFRTPVAAIFAR